MALNKIKCENKIRVSLLKNILFFQWFIATYENG